MELLEYAKIRLGIYTIQELKEEAITKNPDEELLEWLKSLDNKTLLKDIDFIPSEVLCILIRSKLRYANLSGANLAGMDLSFSDLYGANLTGADLRNTKLIFANLDCIDLTNANLEGANFDNTVLGENGVYNIKFAVIVDHAEHSGFVKRLDYKDIWKPNNENGWTYHNIEGPHGSIIDEFNTRDKAEAYLAEYLECDSVETGRYCYSHNPY